MADINKQMAEFARELWENYIKPKFTAEFPDIVSYYMATVVSNDGNNRVTIKRPFDSPYQVSCLEDMAGLEAGDTVLVLRFGNGTNNANHIIFGKGNGNLNYTAYNATELANAAIKTIEYGVGNSPTSHSDITTWSSASPAWESGKYVWQRTTTNGLQYTYACIQGAAGHNTATVYLYQRATSAPSNPTNNLTYTFSTATLSGTIDNNWATDIPTGTNPIYVIAATAFSDTDTDMITANDWSSPVILAQNGTSGTNGINTATVYLYQRKTTLPSRPTNNLTYTFATGVLSGTIDNDWSITIPSGTDPLYVTFATAASNTATDTITSNEWVTPEILVENGEDGTDGQMLYATSSSTASSAAKVATLSSGSLTLEPGATVSVTFTEENSAADATLNVSGTGAKTIRAGGANLTATSPYNWTAGATVTFVYDGTYWQMDGTAPLQKADDAAKVATNYVTDVGTTGIDVTGNNASAKVQITDTVKVVADSTHFSEMTSSQFKVHSGNTQYPSSYLGTEDAGIAGDGSGHYYVRIYNYTPPGGTNSGGAIELFNADGRPRVLIDAFANYGSQRFFNQDGNYMVDIGTRGDGSYGALNLYQTTDVISGGYFASVQLGKVLASSFINTGEAALMIYGDPSAYGSGIAATLTAAYGGKAAYIRASEAFRGYVAHGKTISHRLTFDFDTISGYNFLRFWIDGTEVARIQQQSYSDERVKTDIEPIRNAYKEAVGAVDIEQFRYNFNDAVRQGAYGIMFGIVAQDLIRELDDNGIAFEDTPLVADITNDDESLYSVDYTQFLLARIAHDEDRIKKLEEKNAELEARLAAIEAKLGK